MDLSVKDVANLLSVSGKTIHVANNVFRKDRAKFSPSKPGDAEIAENDA
jgi:hypothetical protein